MKFNISLLVPTRKRPLNVQRLIESAKINADNSNGIEFIFYIDRDDLDSVNAISKFPNTKCIVGDRIVLSEMWNMCYRIADADVFMHCGDDIVIQTQGWDTMVLNEFDKYPDKIAFVHGQDGHWKEALGTHGFLHRNWVEVVGYFVPPYFSSDWNDVWLTDVALLTGRKVYLEGLLTEHMHFSFGKSEIDETHKERMERGNRDNVRLLYDQLGEQRLLDAEKLKRFIEMCK